MPKKFEPIPLDRSPESPTPPSDLPSGLYLHVSDPRVVDLPREGCITFRYTRGPANLTESTDGEPARASVDLNLTEICACEGSDMEDLGDKKDEASEKIDELFEEAQKSEGESEDES